MKRFIKPLNNRGFGLFTFVLILIVIFLGLSGGHFLKSVNENLDVKRDMGSITALYAAEKGIEYVYSELIRSSPDSTNWFTHVVDTNNNDILVRQNGSFLTSIGIRFSDVNQLTDDGYASQPDQLIQFVAKVYNDPSSATGRDKIILVRGQNGTQTRLVAARVALDSLYEYFMFFPEACITLQGVYDAQGGRIHTNENIILSREADIRNVSQLSAAGYFRYITKYKRPPLVDEDATPATPGPITGLTVDSDATKRTLAQRYSPNPNNPIDGTVDPANPVTWAQITNVSPANWRQGDCRDLADPSLCLYDVNAPTSFRQYYNNDKWANRDDWLQGDVYGQICQNNVSGAYGTCTTRYRKIEGDGSQWFYVDPLVHPDVYMYDNYGTGGLVGAAKITPFYLEEDGTGTQGPTVQIPNRLNTPYRYPIYQYDPNAVNFWPHETRADSTRWNDVDYSYPHRGAYVADDLQNSCPDHLCPQVRYLSSYHQADDWANFITNQNGGALNGIVMDHNSGAPTVTSPQINSEIYRTTAATKGILIENTIDPATFNSYSTSTRNTYYRNPTKTLECTCDTDDDGVNDSCCGRYTVTIKGAAPLVPDAEGKITVHVDDAQGDEDIVIFQKRGFYHAQHTEWVQVVEMNVGNIKRAIENGVVPSLNMNITYSDWPLAIANAKKLPSGGMTFVAEGSGYAIGSVNTEDYQPAAIILPDQYRFWALSRDFNYPNTLPDVGNHPDDYYVDAGFRDAVNNQWRQDHQATMPNRVNQSEIYNISIVGSSAASNEWLSWTGYNSLENWAWKNNWLDSNENGTTFGKSFAGTLLQLAQGNFVSRYQYGISESDRQEMHRNRQCTLAECAAGAPYHQYVIDGTPYGGWPSCSGCASTYCGITGEDPCPSTYCGTSNCPDGFTYVLPSVNWYGPTPFGWEADYLTGNLPPGDLVGLNLAGWLLLSDTAYNFNYHCKALQGGL